MRAGRGLGRTEATVVLVGVLVVAVVGGVAARGSSTFSRNVSRAGVVHDIKLHLGLSHLWLEEALAGDAGVDVYRDVYRNVEGAREQCRLMVEGGSSRLGRITPVGSAEGRASLVRLCRGIDEFRALTVNRVALSESSGAGSPTDRAYDTAFKGLLAIADDHVEILAGEIRREHRDLDRAGAGTALMIAALFAVVALLVRRSRRAVGARAVEVARRREEETRLATIVQSSADAIISASTDGLVLTWNPGAQSMFGYTADEMVGQPVSRLAAGDGSESQRSLVHQVGEGRRLRDHEAVRVRKDGTPVPVAVTASPIYDGDGGVVALSAIMRDITDSKALEEALERRAFYDELTGLPNRSLLHDRLAHGMERAARSGLAPAVILLDLDNFKAVNDSLGHCVGDRVLVHVAARLQAAVRPMDTVARLGGDEFVVLVEDPQPGAAIGAAQRVLDALREPAEVAGHTVVLHASAGVAPGEVGQDPDRLLANADAAMYAAKARGKGHWEVFEPEMHRAVLDRLALTVDLAGAAGRGELFVEYQPIVELATGRALGAEALVRWNHPTRGLVSPLEFISIAEDSGQICDVGTFVLRQALDQLGRCQEHDPSFYVSVNVSPVQFRRPEFVGLVTSAVEAAGVDPHRLVLEVTETGLMTDVEDNIEALTELRRRGIRIAIDDFGTGYSSIAYLKRLPVDMVKIDKALVDGVAVEPGVWALAQAILGLIAAVGLETVAEGIEESAQVAHLEALGCTRGQGYHFARPMPAAQLTALVLSAGRLPSRPEPA